jgi:hypothetical protein
MLNWELHVPKPVQVVHVGTGVTCETFATVEDARKWITDYRVSETYKQRWYRIVPTAEGKER